MLGYHKERNVEMEDSSQIYSSVLSKSLDLSSPEKFPSEFQGQLNRHFAFPLQILLKDTSAVFVQSTLLQSLLTSRLVGDGSVLGS